MSLELGSSRPGTPEQIRYHSIDQQGLQHPPNSLYNLKSTQGDLMIVLQKDAHVYFDDGNIVLVAGMTCFRVHRSLLAKYSSIFRDMFSLPQPEDQEMYDGVPMVELQDDPDILRALLRVIYEPFSSPLKMWLTQPTIQSTTEMVGAMSLALKYDVESLRKEIVRQFSSAWPHTLEDWDILEKKREMFGNDMPRLDPAAAIRMARIADMPEVLPLAYYCTIQVYPRRPMIGDGDDLPHEADPEDQIMTHLLTREDLASLALGRESMAIWVAQRAKSCFRTWSCHSNSNQRGFVCSQRIHLRWAEVLEDVTTKRDILEVLREHANWGMGTFGNILCSPCQSVYVDIMRQMRKDLFQDLPQIFGLG